MIQQGLTGADPGFFSVGGAPLRNGLAKKFTSQYKLIRANTKKKASTQEGVGDMRAPITLPLDLPLS